MSSQCHVLRNIIRRLSMLNYTADIVDTLAHSFDMYLGQLFLSPFIYEMDKYDIFNCVQWLSLSMNNVDYQEDHVLDSLSSVFYEAGSKGLYPSFTDIHTAVMEWERAHPNELSHFPPQLPINVSAANFTSDGSHPATDLPPDFSADKVHVGKFTNQTQISSSSHTSSAEDVVWSSPFPVRKGASVNNNGAQCEEVDTSPILLADETTKLTSVLTQLSPPGRSHELNDANETTEQTSSVPDLHEDAMATQVKPMIEDFTYVNTDKVLSTAESSGAESQDVTQTPHEDMVQDNNRTTQDAASTLMVEDFEQMTGEHFEQKMGEFSEQTTGEVSEQTMTQDIVQDAEQMTIEDSEQRTRDAGGIMMAIGDGEQVMMHEDSELTTFKDVAHMTMRYDAEPPTDENIEGEDGDVRDDDGRPVEDAMQYKRITRRQAQNQRRNLSTRPTEHVEDDAADEVNYVTEEDAKPLQTKTRKKTKSAGLSRTKWNARATVKQKPTEPISRKELRISDEDLVTAPYPCFHCFSSSSTCRIGAGSTAMKRACNRCTIRKQSCSFNMNSALIKQRHEPNSVHARAIPYIAMLFGGNVPQTTPEVQQINTLLNDVKDLKEQVREMKSRLDTQGVYAEHHAKENGRRWERVESLLMASHSGGMNTPVRPPSPVVSIGVPTSLANSMNHDMPRLLSIPATPPAQHELLPPLSLVQLERDTLPTAEKDPSHPISSSATPSASRRSKRKLTETTEASQWKESVKKKGKRVVSRIE